MLLAKIDENRIILNVIVAELTDELPEGTWVECPPWTGIGLSVDMPEPAPPIPPVPPSDQPATVGTQDI